MVRFKTSRKVEHLTENGDVLEPKNADQEEWGGTAPLRMGLGASAAGPDFW